MPSQVVPWACEQEALRRRCCTCGASMLRSTAPYSGLTLPDPSPCEMLPGLRKGLGSFSTPFHSFEATASSSGVGVSHSWSSSITLQGGSQANLHIRAQQQPHSCPQAANNHQEHTQHSGLQGSTEAQSHLVVS